MTLGRFIGSAASSLPPFRNPESNWALNVAGLGPRFLRDYSETVPFKLDGASITGTSSFLTTSALFFGKIETLCIEQWSSSANFSEDAGD
jgi:hypothetical protein